MYSDVERHESGPWAPSILARWIPVLLLLALSATAVVLLPNTEAYNLWIVSELGLIENGTVLLALIGAVIAWRIFRNRECLPSRWLGLWYLCFAVGLVYLAGEEASWGQQWFGWETPPDYAAANIQNETNIHNLYNWTEQVPKIALGGAVYIAGILWPLYCRFRRPPAASPRGWFAWIWPPAYLWPSAVIALGIRIFERFPVWFGADADHYQNHLKALKEGNELFLILFVALYLHAVWHRLRRTP